MRKILLLIFLVLFSILNAAALADSYTYDAGNNTAYIFKNSQKWLEVKSLGSISGISTFTETLQVTSNYRYDFSVLDDFGEQYEVRKGKTKIEELSTIWYSQVTEDYNVTVDDYGINSNWTSKDVWNNQTSQNETVWYWDNKTIVVGSHTENRTRINESLFNPTNKKIEAGQTLIFKKITVKKAEVGEFSILLKPVFMGVSIKELTWWNGSSGKKKPIHINNTGNSTTFTYFQVNLNVTYDPDMNNNGSDLNVVNETSGLAEPLWVESQVNGSYFNLVFNASNIPGGAWTNSTYYLYYNSSVATSASNVNTTFIRVINDAQPVKGAWSLDNDALDKSGNNNNGTLNGGMGYVAGKFGNAGSFDGVNDYINLGTNPSLHIPNNISIVAWIKRGDLGAGEQAIVGKGAVANGYTFELYQSRLSFIIRGVAGYESINTISDTTNYYFVAATYDGSNVRLYINGTLDNTLAVTAQISNYTGNALIGAHGNLAAYFNGDIDNVRVYSKTLTGSEIQDLCNNYGYVTPNYPGRELVRKYTSPEITAQLGAEESNTTLTIISNSTSRTFTAVWDSSVNVVWYWNGTSIQTNNSVTSASYTNSSLINGTHNITATGTSGNNTASQTWLWTISMAQVGEAVREFIQVIII